MQYLNFAITIILIIITTLSAILIIVLIAVVTTIAILNLGHYSYSSKVSFYAIEIPKTSSFTLL